jgi:hypothetical protein
LHENRVDRYLLIYISALVKNTAQISCIKAVNVNLYFVNFDL